MKKFALVLVFAMAACGRDNSNTGGAGGSAGTGGTGGMAGTGGSGGGMVSTIANLRMHPPGDGVAVTLQNVVVVQRVDSSKHGDVYVQDMGGGMYSGIHVYCNYDTANNPPKCPMNRTAIQGIHRGDVVNVAGNFKNFMFTQPTGAPTELEVEAPMITSTGQTGTPTAINVTASQVAKGVATGGMNPVPPPPALDGVYVKVTDGPFMVSNANPIEFQGPCPVMTDAGQTMTSFGVEATHGSDTLALGLTFHTSMNNTTSLTYCTGTCFGCTNEISGHTFSTVSGIAAGSSDSSTAQVFFEIMPTIDTDLPQ